MYSSWSGGKAKKHPCRDAHQRHFNCGEGKSSGCELVLCVDLEFNIGRDKNLNTKEIVEVGIVLTNKLGKVIDSFTSFCRPSFGWVSDETLNFIHVEREAIENAPDLKAVLKSVDSHFSKYLDDVDYWCSWGDMDLAVMQHGMGRCGIVSTVFSQAKYVNAQDRYDYRFKSYRRTSLAEAVFNQGLSFSGNAHRALSDAFMLSSLIRCWVL